MSAIGQEKMHPSPYQVLNHVRIWYTNNNMNSAPALPPSLEDPPMNHSSTSPSLAASVPSGSPVFEANDFYMPNGASVGTYPTVEPFMSIAPGFVNYGDATGAGADFHLGSGSGLVSAGIVLPQVTNDFYGNSRGATYSVGAAK